MRKLLFGAVATAIIALQPNLALAQRTPSNFIKETFDATAPTITEFTHRILQTIPVSATSAGLPAGVLGTARCIEGSSTGARQGAFEHIRFVGNVLCLDPGSDGTFRSFASNCPAGTTPVVQGVKLIKIEQRSPKCPDVYPGGTFVMTPVGTGIRTWWPLKHTPCRTEFRLEVEYACLRDTPLPRVVVPPVRVNVYHFIVSITPDTLSWLVHALHNEPLGVCEVPCITDEALFDLLLRQADTIRTTAAAAVTASPAIRDLNTALDTMEATIVARCIFLLSVWQADRDSSGNITAIHPCVLFGPQALGGPWGNYTVGDFGWGIVDTLENPCCCKLITDLTCLKLDLIGNDP